MSKSNNAPNGWKLTGESPFDYETGLDNNIVNHRVKTMMMKLKII
ncbi:hypothetical protein ACFFJF_10445 [Allobacillus sp. GCM10007489]|nr:hypothetical protein [Allobacillus sp. SKP2-8]